MKQTEITCSECGADALLVRSPRYEGFTKTGETLKCSSCGHEFASEQEVPFKKKTAARVFDESDVSRKIEVFRENEKGRTCCYCRHYLVNPFTQRCGLHMRVVEATDSCGEFAVRETVAVPKAADTRQPGGAV